jgi:hypothetical protein
MDIREALKLNSIGNVINAIISLFSGIFEQIPQPAVYTPTVTITDSEGPIALGTLTIAGIPAGRTVQQLFVHWLCRQASNSNALVNSLDGAQDLQVKKNSGAFSTFFSFAGGEFLTPGAAGGVNGGSSGDAKRGTVDLAALAPVNGDVLTFQLTDGVAAEANLILDAFEIIVELWC